MASPNNTHANLSNASGGEARIIPIKRASVPRLANIATR